MENKKPLTVRQLINKLLDLQSSFDELVCIAIRKDNEDGSQTLYVGDINSLTIESPKQIGDYGVWIETKIKNIHDPIQPKGQVKK